MIGFERKKSFSDLLQTNLLGLSGELDAKQTDRLAKIKQAWDFYEGYHWENLPEQDTPELTYNYCRAFVDKFVAFELGKAFSITTHKSTETIPVTTDKRTLFEYLEDVWEDNKQYIFCTELGQMKSITGEAWVQIVFDTPESLDDPYGQYPDGRIRIMLMNTSTVFPEFDPHERGKLVKLTVMYVYEALEKTGILGKTKKVKRTFKQVWTKDEVATYEDTNRDPEVIVNKYGTIPFVCIKNLPLAGRNEGRSDLEDIIPLNTEYNRKSSDVSEIIDYHAAPVTLVFGAKVGNLEKGANKLWGGLSKDARVENLELNGDLGVSRAYIDSLKLSMCEVGGIPETVLGGAQAISNTSGVALQYINLPLIEKTRVKRMETETGLESVNRLIILVSMLEGLITKPQSIEIRDFVWNSVDIPDTLPKDTLLELQQIQVEMKQGLESRENAMKRLGKENIAELMKIIDEDVKKNACFYGHIDPNDYLHGQNPQLNSGMTNSETPVETVRKEVTGQNGGGE